MESKLFIIESLPLLVKNLNGEEIMSLDNDGNLTIKGKFKYKKESLWFKFKNLFKIENSVSIKDTSNSSISVNIK